MSLKLDKSSWKRVAFGDVVRNLNITVKDPKSVGIERVIAMEHLDPGELKISRWSSIQDGTTFTRRVKPGHTLFGKRRAYQRKAAHAEFDAITSGDILVLQADETHLLPELLPFLVQSDGFYKHALGTSAGSLSPRTNWRDLANYEFDLPHFLDEQKRLAELLWAVEQHRRRVYREHETMAAARSVWVSKQIARLLECGTTTFDQVWSRSPESGWSSPPVDEDTGHYVLSLAALGPDGYRPGHLKNVSDSIERHRTLLSPGDLLVSRANTAEAVGRVGIFDGEQRDDVSFPDTMMRIRLVNGVEPRFVEAVLASAHGRTHMRRTAAGSATSMVKINRKSLARLPFPVLSDCEQDALLAGLRTIDDAIAALTEAISAIQSTKTSLLHSIFGGAT